MTEQANADGGDANTVAAGGGTGTAPETTKAATKAASKKKSSGEPQFTRKELEAMGLDPAPYGFTDKE